MLRRARVKGIHQEPAHAAQPVTHRGELVSVGELLTYHTELARRLHARDRVHTYGSFYIADVAA